MKALLGGETTLHFLPDELLIWVVQQWRKLHPCRELNDVPAVVKFDEKALTARIEASRIYREMSAAVETRLTSQQVAELQTIYYLGRDEWFPEFYDQQIERTIEEHASTSEYIGHLMEKTNFLRALTRALPRLGRPSLAARLSQL